MRKKIISFFLAVMILLLNVAPVFAGTVGTVSGSIYPGTWPSSGIVQDKGDYLWFGFDASGRVWFEYVSHDPSGGPYTPDSGSYLRFFDLTNSNYYNFTVDVLDIGQVYYTDVFKSYFINGHSAFLQYYSGSGHRLGSSSSLAISFGPPPSAPTGLSATGTGEHMTLSWSSVTGASSYNIYQDSILVGSSSTLNYSLYNVVGTHSYYVAAVSPIGVEGSSSSTVSYTGLISPNYPTNLSVSGAGGDGTLTWSPASGATGYNVYRNGVFVSSVLSTSYSFSGLSPGSYNYTVSAYNDAGEGARSDQVSYIVLGLPGEVTGVNVSGTGANYGLITWTASPESEQVINYNVYDSGTVLGHPTVNSYYFSDLSPGVHAFSVSATNPSGEGPRSDVISYDVLSAPVAPTLTANHLDYDTVTLNWDDVGQAITYDIYQDNSKIATVTSGVTSYKVTGLMSKTSYNFQVKSLNSIGSGSMSNIVNITTSAPPSVIFTGQSVDMGLKMSDIFAGIVLFIGQFWPLIALGIAVPVAFLLGRRVMGLGKGAGSESAAGNGKKKFFRKFVTFPKKGRGLKRVNQIKKPMMNQKKPYKKISSGLMNRFPKRKPKTYGNKRSFVAKRGMFANKKHNRKNNYFRSRSGRRPMSRK